MNPIAKAKAKSLGLTLYKSDRPNKKYFIIHPKTHKKIYFGNPLYSDFTIHKDPLRRLRYIKRHKGILAKDKRTGKLVPAWTIKYSPSWLSLRLLWSG